VSSLGNDREWMEDENTKDLYIASILVVDGGKITQNINMITSIKLLQRCIVGPLYTSPLLKEINVSKLNEKSR